MRAKRTHRELRKRGLTDCALAVMLEKGIYATKRGDIARKAGVNPSLINHYFGDLEDVRNEAILTALDADHFGIQCAVVREAHPLQRLLTPEQRAKAVAHIHATESE